MAFTYGRRTDLSPAVVDALGSADPAVGNLTLRRGKPFTRVHVGLTDVDLGKTAPFPIGEHLVVKLSTAVANGANNKNVNVGIQHTTANTDGTANTGNSKHSPGSNWVIREDLKSSWSRHGQRSGIKLPGGRVNGDI